MGELCGQTTDERYLRESVFDVDVMIVRDFMAGSRLCGCGERASGYLGFSPFVQKEITCTTTRYR